MGASLDVTLGSSGSITGGMRNDLLAQANAVTFTSGTNAFELQADGTAVSGNVVDMTNNGTFRLGGATSRSFD
ncbi:MAG: hypothetical protein ACRD9W_05220, partial [Terriglobia bacterium]